MKPAAEITLAQLREHYARTCLARLGMPFEQAIELPAIRLTLTRAAQASRAHRARLAQAAAIQYQTDDRPVWKTRRQAQQEAA